MSCSGDLGGPGAAHLRGASERARFACQNCNCKMLMALLTGVIDGDHNDADNDAITISICCECLGISNPVSHVSLDLMPVKRLGTPTSEEF